jgi:hypothetical protein
LISPSSKVSRLTGDQSLRNAVRHFSRTAGGNGRFAFQRHENGVDVSFPVRDELQSAIDAMPKTNQPRYLHTTNTLPWIAPLKIGKKRRVSFNFDNRRHPATACRRIATPRRKVAEEAAEDRARPS